MSNMNYFYDGQCRRYIIQVIRVFSHFQIKEMTSAGEVLTRVPCRYADASRLVSHILRNNSENSIMNAPQIAVSIQNIQLAPERRQDPRLVDTQQITERQYDESTGNYTNQPGNLYTVQRYMPVPYNITIQVDFLTTNTDSKLQLLEQIMVLFNPSLQLQVNDNPIDWGNIFELELTDIQWSNRSIPSGTEEVMDISTMSFMLPVWISPPAKVTRQKIIDRIITDIHSVPSIRDLGFNDQFSDFFAQFQETARHVITPGDYRVSIQGNEATLIDASGLATSWVPLLEIYGPLNTDSLLELNLSNDIEDLDTRVIGVVEETADENILTFTLDIDTLASDTLAPVDSVIDPYNVGPGITLPAATIGQRYLIVKDLTVDNPAWNVDAIEGSIIEYNGTNWIVSYAGDTQIEYVTNTFTGEQFKWDGEWVSSWMGEYNAGFWRLKI